MQCVKLSDIIPLSGKDTTLGERHPGVSAATIVILHSGPDNTYCPLWLSASGTCSGIFNKGVRGNSDLHIKIVDSPDLIRDIFVEYLHSVLISVAESNRSLPGTKPNQQSHFVTITHVTA
jgi:hypothetical protein